MQLYTGVVENRQDPLKLGRCQVRVVGLHTDDKTMLPTEDLPWAYPMQPVTSAAISGLGHSPIGAVNGTWVVIMFRDEDNQQPIMLGTVGGMPQTKSGQRAIDDSNDSILPQDGVLTSSDGTPVTSGDGTPIKTGTNQANNSAPKAPTPAPVAPPTAATVAASDIPLVPPPKSGASSKAVAGIKALIAACDKVGLTTKYAKCALLGIAGGESKWEPQKEGMTYNPVRLKQIFSQCSDEQVEKYSYAEKKGMSRADFFAFFYGTTFSSKGAKLGNKSDTDGGKYFGRGFIQLTGRYNYERYQKLGRAAGLDLNIVDDPDSLDTNLDTSALVAALYLKDRVKGWEKLMYEPGFFLAAKTSVGVNSPDIALVKRNYYEYFLGGSVGPESTNKNATASEPNLSKEEIAAAPPDKKEAYTEDRSMNSAQLGFTDPNGKYPLRDHMNEADTNRLARGVIEGTCFGFKDAIRKLNIPVAGGGSWSQPLSSYNTVYPFNKVFESESGHVMEFDDSPDGERIHLYHRKGTFLEMDPNGSQMNVIVGDNYQIVTRNNNIYIVGTANLTVGGSIKILVQGDADIEVDGQSSIMLKGDAAIGVAGDLDMTIGGDYNLKVAGAFNVDSGKAVSVKTAENFNVDSSAGVSVRASTDIDVLSYGNTHIESQAELNLKAASNSNLESSGDFNILTSGTFSAGYTRGNFGSGAGSASSATVTVVPAINATPPELLNSVVAGFDNMEPPERSFDDIAKFETPDEWESPAGMEEKIKQFDTPAYKAPENKAGVAQETAVLVPNTVVGKTVDTAAIYSRTDFPPSYKLSKNFSIGQLVEPSVILQDVNVVGKLFKKQDIIANLAALAENICEPLYDLLGPTGGKFAAQSSKGAWCINSGLRNGTNNSDHNRGRALDMRYNPKRSFEDMWKLAVQLEKILPYNQIILEYRKPGAANNSGTSWMNWIHISYSTEGNQKMAFTMIDDKSVDATGSVKPGSRGLFLFGS